ncbi:MAG TPA: D-amino-acid transaminase [Rhizomicrobium sp.]
MTRKGWNGRAPAGRIAYVDGRYLPHGRAGVHIEDRGLQLADSIYEVCAISDGLLIDQEEHLDRLVRSLGEIGMAMPMSRHVLALVMHELVRRNRARTGLLYLQVTRGAARRDHPIPTEELRPTLIMTVRELGAAGIAQRQEEGIKVITRPDERWARCDIKTTQLLPNLLAKTAARKAGAYEAWLIDDDGFVTEGSSTNAWIVDVEGRLTTRQLSNEILPGVTRRVIMEAAAEAQLRVFERKFTRAEASGAREAFISSATGVVPVIAIDGQTIGDGRPGPITQRVQQLYAHRSNAAAAKLAP